MKTYWYETHTGTIPRRLVCVNDEEVLATLRVRYGPDLMGITIIYEEESAEHNRTVWMQ